jgi:hypothetical protein
MASSIGVHAYGGAINSGTPIGPYGIPMSRYISVMDSSVKLTREIRYVPENVPKDIAELPLVNAFDPVISIKGGAFQVKMSFADEEFGFGDIMSIGTKVLGDFFESSFEDEDLNDAAAVEGFFDFLGNAAKSMGNVSLPVVLGPAGVPVSMVANAAINNLARSLQKRQSNAEGSGFNEEADLKKHLYQAALADATFDACCKHHKILNEDGFFDIIKKWIPVGIKAAVAAGSAIEEFAKTTATGNGDSTHSWDANDNQWKWDTQPINPGSRSQDPFEGLKNAIDLGDHYKDFVDSMKSKQDCFSNIKWESIQKHQFRSQNNFLDSLSQSSAGASLTESMHIVITMRALAATLLSSAIENASPEQLRTIDEEGFFTDTTATLKKLLGKYGDKLVTHGPQILGSINAIVKNHQGNI